MPSVTRTLAYVLGVPALSAPWIFLWAHDTSMAVAILGVSLGASGAVLCLRVYPLRLLTSPPAGAREKLNETLFELLPIGGLIGAGVAASALLAAGIGTLTGEFDASSLLVAPGTLLIAALCLLFGFCAGFIVLLPLFTLVREVQKTAAGKRVDSLLVAGSVLLLLVGVFAVAIALAVPGESTHGARSGLVLALLVFFTVLFPQPDDVASVGALWVARAALLAIIAAVIWVAAAQPRRRRRSRKSEVAGLSQVGPAEEL